jgi:hypothetical protein
MGTEVSKDASSASSSAGGNSDPSNHQALSVEEKAKKQKEISKSDNAIRSKTRKSQFYQMKIVIRY